MDLFEELMQLVGELEKDHVEYALVGGLAVAAWGAPRATKDIDLLVRSESIHQAMDAVTRRRDQFLSVHFVIVSDHLEHLGEVL